LKAVEISGCGLREVSKENLAGLEDLEVLILESNQLTSLNDDLFENNRKLTHISFRNNMLGKLSSDLFDPIASDQLVYVNFLGNLDIKAVYNRDQEESISFNELMESIEDNCSNEDSLSRSAFDVDFSDSQMESDDETLMLDENQVITLNGFNFFKEIAVDQSPVLAADIEKDVTDFQFEGFSNTAILNLLNYLHGSERWNNGDVCGTLKLAIQLQITEMVLKLLENSVNNDNIQEILKLGLEMNTDALKQASLEMMRSLHSVEIPVSLTFEDLLKLTQFELEHIAEVKAKIKELMEANVGSY
jgi:hypothetical protein